MSSSSSSDLLHSPCPHLAAHRSNLRALQRILRPKPLGGAEVRRDPGEVPTCAVCPAAAPRLYACLACAALHCAAHSPAHSLAGHEIALDVHRAELFCRACDDQIYDPDLDAAAALAQFSQPPPSAAARRRRAEYRPWVPDPTEQEAVCRGSSSMPSTSTSPWGLRGMNNLGNTCFMNSVLQALLHAPPLRNYFLSDLHNRFLCQQQRTKRKKSGGTRVCLVCDLDAMYSAVFSGDRTPYSPAKFLYSWWQHASNLASYEQQDAHEFFISILDGIHEKMGEDQQKPHNQGYGDCCIAHRVFSGILRSDVTCTNCGFTSTTYDPCVDVSLDLDSSKLALKATPSKSHARNGEAESLLSSQSFATLKGCLDRFTRPERLGPDQKFFCQRCQVRQESLKQMSIRKLPLVICFHIKRFEHLSTRKLSRKVDSYLQFPFSLDMSPYLSSTILRSRFGNRIFAFDGEDSDTGAELASKFELFAVITHSGRLEAGHYIAYLRLNNQWYKCDDAWITHVSENTVRASQAYMLFYVQKMLYYKASENAVAS